MGDAAFGMTGLDFETAARCGIPITTIVLNNSTMAIETHAMALSHERYRARDLGGNYANLARDLGGWSERVEDPARSATRSCAPAGRTRTAAPPARIHHQPGDRVLAARGVMEEAAALQHAAEWRLRKVDADPSDATSRAAAALLEKNWRTTSACSEHRRCSASNGDLQLARRVGEIADFMDMANDYRARIGVDRSPENGEAYLRALIDLAKRTFGTA